MYFLTKFQRSTLKYDLINAHNFNSNLSFPKFKTIILNLRLKTCDIKQLSIILLAFELITQQQGQLVSAWKSKISLKIRKGSAIGCKLIIKKNNPFIFINKIFIEQIVLKLNTKKIQNYQVFQFIIQNIWNVSELKSHYNFFYNLRSLKIIIWMNYNNKNSTFFLKSFANQPENIA